MTARTTDTAHAAVKAGDGTRAAVFTPDTGSARTGRPRATTGPAGTTTGGTRPDTRITADTTDTTGPGVTADTAIAQT